MLAVLPLNGLLPQQVSTGASEPLPDHAAAWPRSRRRRRRRRRRTVPLPAADGLGGPRIDSRAPATRRTLGQMTTMMSQFSRMSSSRGPMPSGVV